MIAVGVSGAGGRMGSLVVAAVTQTDDLAVAGLYDPHHAGRIAPGVEISDDPAALSAADVVVEFTRPDVVLENLGRWRAADCNAVVGTSGFDDDRVAAVAEAWGAGPPNCLIVPNFSIGAVVMMKLAVIAAPHFAAAEVVEFHHDRKADAPSGTAAATAQRIADAADQHRAVESAELVPGSRGADISGVPVHAVRLPGLVAHQAVMFGGPGETLTIKHDTTDRASFLPGVLLAIRRVSGLAEPVTVGLEDLLGL